MTTINGKSLPQVFQELSVPAPELQKSLMGMYKYYPIEAYEARMQSVVGLTHYRVEYSPVSSISLDGQEMLSCICTLSLYDDAGTCLYRTQGAGTLELEKAKESGRYIGLNNAGYKCQLSAFKSACKSIQIFGIHSEEDEIAQTDSGKKAEKKEKKPDAKETFFTAGAFSVVREDTRTGKPVYKVPAQRKVGSVMEQTVSEILFYPNQYKDCAGDINVLQSLCADGKMHRLNIRVSRGNYPADVPQYIFKGFFKGE